MNDLILCMLLSSSHKNDLILYNSIPHPKL